MNNGVVADTQSRKAWIEQVISSLDKKEYTPLGDLLPEFPPALLQTNTTSLSGEAGIRQAGAFYTDVASTLEAAGAPLRDGQKVLDFGCGWGRIGRMFLHDTSKECIHGIDVDPEFVAISRQLFRSDNFMVCEPMPPAPNSAAEYDLVVAYSVFSHLSEAAARAWLTEFHRLLRPGGFVAFTTRHESFFDYLDWARGAENVGSYTHALGNLFDDTSVPRALLKKGNLVHATSRGVAGGGVRNETFYGETWIPEQYLTREFGNLFEHMATCFDPKGYDQVAYVLRKRA